MQDIPDGWTLFQEGGCPNCGGDIYAADGSIDGTFPDGADAMCGDCEVRGQVSADDGEAWFKETEP